MYYYTEKGIIISQHKEHIEAFKLFDESTVKPRAVVRVELAQKYFKPINCNYDGFDNIEIKEPFYKLGLSYVA